MARRRLALPADPEDFRAPFPTGALASVHCGALGLLAIAGACVASVVNLPFAVALALEGVLLVAPWAHRTARRLRERHELQLLARYPSVGGRIVGESGEPVLVAHDDALVLRPLRVRLDDGRVVSLEGEVAVDRADSTELEPGHRVRVQA